MLLEGKESHSVKDSGEQGMILPILVAVALLSVKSHPQDRGPSFSV